MIRFNKYKQNLKQIGNDIYSYDTSDFFFEYLGQVNRDLIKKHRYTKYKLNDDIIYKHLIEKTEKYFRTPEYLNETKIHYCSKDIVEDFLNRL